MLSDRGSVLMRVDGNAAIGTGHLIRCLALAAALQKAGGAAVIATSDLAADLRARAHRQNVPCLDIAAVRGSLVDAESCCKLAAETRASWIIADGYDFKEDFQEVIVNHGLKLLIVDDYGHSNHYHSHLVLNQNFYASPVLYSNRVAHTQLLLGPEFALLRDQFARWTDWERTLPPKANRILVTLGGSDPENATGKVLQALESVNEDVEVIVLIGAANPHRTALGQAGSISRRRVSFQTDAPDVAELMAWADIGVIAGGSTALEAAMMGLPVIVLVTAENQVGVATAIQALGLGISLGRIGEITVPELAETIVSLQCDPCRHVMSDRGRQLVDGGGCLRTLQAMRLT